MDTVKRILSVVMVVILLFTVVPVGFNVGALGEEDFEYEIIDDTAIITGYMGNEEVVVIPDILDGYSVTGIGDYAFYECESLTSIEIPGSIISIGDYAFYRCYSLTGITVDNENKNYCDVDGVLFDKDVKTLIQYPVGNERASFSIPDSVTSIGDYAFYYCDDLTNIEVPDSVTNVGGYAFYGCKNLESFTIPDGVTRIYGSTFQDCTSLKSIIIGSSVISIGNYAFKDTEYYNNENNWKNGVLYIGDYLIKANHNIKQYEIKEGTKIIADNAFEYCRDLESVVILDSVTSIGNSAFSGCESLESISIPDSVISIEGYAFYECENLATITIPDTVKSIGYDAFCDTAYYNDETNWNNGLLYICNHLVDVENDIKECNIKVGTKTVAECTFYDCDELVTLNIPYSVVNLEDAFEYLDGEPCYSLTEITVDENNEYYSSDEYGALFNKGKTELIKYPLGNSRTSYVIPDGVTSIVSSSFDLSENLTSITIPDSVTYIGASAFYECSSLTSVTIGTGVADIRNGAFNYCDNITDVYYSGSEEQWNEINIGERNECLTSADIHFSENEEETTKAPEETTTSDVEKPTESTTAKEDPSTTTPTTTVKAEPDATKPTPTVVAPQTTAPTTSADKTQTTEGKNETSQKATKPAKVKSSAKPTSTKKKQAVVTWKKTNNVNGYQVAYSTSKKFTKKTTKTRLVKKAKSTKLTLKKLKSGKKYFIRIRAYKTVSGKKIFGSWGKVMNVKVK